MTSPGTPRIPPSDLVKVRSGWAVTGVVSLAMLLPGVGSAPFVPSSPTLAVLVIVSTPAGRGLITVTVKVVEALVPPPDMDGPPRVQRLPAVLFGKQLQMLPVKVVFAGTVSVSTRPVMPWLPVFV